MNSLLLGEAHLFVLFRPTTSWMRLTHNREDSLFYPKFTNLNVNHIRKHPLTHKINHHTPFAF